MVSPEFEEHILYWTKQANEDFKIDPDSHTEAVKEFNSCRKNRQGMYLRAKTD